MFPRILDALAFATFLAGLGRLVFLYGWRTPVRARLVNCQLSSDELVHERRKLATDREYRRVLCKVAYTVAGRDYSSDVGLNSRAGEMPDSEVTVWVDPNDPSVATARGPDSAAMLIIIGLVWMLALRQGA